MPNKFNFADFGMQAAQDVVGAGLGLALGGINDQRQLKQQGKLQKLQIQGQKEMTSYNQAAALKMWQDTNYSAQMEQLKKAGLNPGMIYGMSGGGGATAAIQSGNVTGAHAPTGGGEAIAMGSTMAQLGLMRAQKENIEADTANKKADIPIKGAQVPNIQASTTSLLQGVENAKIQKEIMETESALKNIEHAIKSATQNNAIALIRQELRTSWEKMEIAKNEQKISTATMQQNIEKISAELAGIYATNELQRTMKGKAEADIANIANNIKVTLGQLANETDRVKIQQQLTNFETSFGGQAAQVLQTLLGLLPSRGKQTTVTHQGGAQNTTTHRRE